MGKLLGGRWAANITIDLSLRDIALAIPDGHEDWFTQPDEGEDFSLETDLGKKPSRVRKPFELPPNNQERSFVIIGAIEATLWKFAPPPCVRSNPGQWIAVELNADRLVFVPRSFVNLCEEERLIIAEVFARGRGTERSWFVSKVLLGDGRAVSFQLPAPC